jgi:hypothetical protein
LAPKSVASAIVAGDELPIAIARCRLCSCRRCRPWLSSTYRLTGAVVVAENAGQAFAFFVKRYPVASTARREIDLIGLTEAKCCGSTTTGRSVSHELSRLTDAADRDPLDQRDCPRGVRTEATPPFFSAASASGAGTKILPNSAPIPSTPIISLRGFGCSIGRARRSSPRDRPVAAACPSTTIEIVGLPL